MRKKTGYRFVGAEMEKEYYLFILGVYKMDCFALIIIKKNIYFQYIFLFNILVYPYIYIYRYLQYIFIRQKDIFKFINNTFLYTTKGKDFTGNI